MRLKKKKNIVNPIESGLRSWGDSSIVMSWGYSTPYTPELPRIQCIPLASTWGGPRAEIMRKMEQLSNSQFFIFTRFHNSDNSRLNSQTQVAKRNQPPIPRSAPKFWSGDAFLGKMCRGHLSAQWHKFTRASPLSSRDLATGHQTYKLRLVAFQHPFMAVQPVPSCRHVGGSCKGAARQDPPDFRSSNAEDIWRWYASCTQEVKTYLYDLQYMHLSDLSDWSKHHGCLWCFMVLHIGKFFDRTTCGKDFYWNMSAGWLDSNLHLDSADHYKPGTLGWFG